MRSPKKLTAAVLLGVMAMSSIGISPASAKTFSDVPDTHWAYEPINTVSNEKLMIGRDQGLFAPDELTTRAEFASVLYNLTTESNLTKNRNTELANSLVDVSSADWFYEAVSWAYSRGLIEDTNGYFNPNEPISREDMAVATYEFLKRYCDGKFVLDDSYNEFIDNDMFSSEAARGKVFILVNNGILAGRRNGYLDPQGALTRAETATMAIRIQDVQDLPDNTDYFKKEALEKLTDGTVEVSKEEQNFIDLLNKDRLKSGDEELEVSPLLMEAARERAKEVCAKIHDLNKEEFFGYDSTFFHTRPNGEPAKTILNQFIKSPSAVISSQIRFGENLVRSWGNVNMTPSEAYNSLLTSPEHVENMMDDQHKYIGVGFYNDGKNSVWVQLFGNVWLDEEKF